MKKKFTFTKESSFTHLKDRMHNEATEHIVQDSETKKLYHHVVSYGSWFNISYSSIFMSHLLRKIGLTGFGIAYGVDDCDVKLPCYPYNRPTRKSIVEVPEGIRLQDLSFVGSNKETSKHFQETFLGKIYTLTNKTGNTYRMQGKDVWRKLIGCYFHQICEIEKEDGVMPFYCVLTDFGGDGQKDLTKILTETNILEDLEVRQVLKKFVKIDIDKAIKALEDEISDKMPSLSKELKERQQIISNCLIKQSSIQK